MTATLLVEETRRRLGPAGAWVFPPELGQTPIDVEREQVARIDRLGYGSLWTGQSPANPSHREIVAQLAIWLAATERTLVGSGIVNIMGRHPTITQGAAATLAEAYPDRLVLGLGAGHRFQAEALGETYDRPVERMRGYLDRMDAAAAAAARPVPRVLAALHPRMLALARERADGAHPFLVPVAHTAAARQALGPDKLLIPHQAVLLDDDPGRARATARSLFTLGSIYGQNLRRFGFDDADFANGASDRPIDAVIAWGDERAIGEKVREHLEAGADHVLVHPLNPDLRVGVDWLERLAPVLLARQARVGDIRPAPGRDVERRRSTNMSERDGYPASVPCWVETVQPDPDAAAAFYRGLFGWELEDVMPPGSGGKYLMARLRGGDVAAVSSPPPGAPPQAVWNTYIAVDSADETAARARAAGGSVVAEPFDVMDAGRMAVLADLEGAVLMVWQAGSHKGARIVNEHGAVNFNNLYTRDVDAARRFYSAVFGWDTFALPGGQAWALPGYGDYLEQLTPGIRKMTADFGVPGFEDVVAAINPIAAGDSDTPAHWGVTFGADDALAASQKATELGGAVVAPPVDAPFARVAVLRDPQGAVFTVSQFVPENQGAAG